MGDQKSPRTRIGVLFRADGGPSAGLGHISRCLSLAAALQQLGAECGFVTGGDIFTSELIRSGRCEVYPALSPGMDNDLKAIISLIAKHKISVVVVDSYVTREDYLLRLRDEGVYSVSIDDRAQYSFPCQLVVNSGILASQLSYRSSTGDTHFLLGSEYALLGPEFWNLPNRKSRRQAQNVLVTLGGSDEYDLMPKLMQLLDNLPFDFKMTCIVGPFFRNRRNIDSLAKSCHHETIILESARSLREVMLESDLAISAGGQTLFELAATGTPAVAVQLADNQATNLHGFAEKEIIRLAGTISDPNLIKTINEAVMSLMTADELRLKMSEAGTRLIDGLGARRVAHHIANDVGLQQSE